ncbi:hypothetical protein SAMN05216535_3935 [Stutzerimonas xanthomarina]|uniref:Uncharacterized protein n=2 Tax=Stutzerimonas xanthomarina TaxID=271420 RepID=A0A1M5KKZ4_9GAMM|nr:hypothetical protein SAMN05216535_3935 [Stutzerimonas xanthomarina]SHG53418.1 hypothetical protein SAMN02744645_0540 [Stutzerimonas xanthomarina DSM 18231]
MPANNAEAPFGSWPLATAAQLVHASELPLQ